MLSQFRRENEYIERGSALCIGATHEYSRKSRFLRQNIATLAASRFPEHLSCKYLGAHPSSFSSSPLSPSKWRRIKGDIAFLRLIRNVNLLTSRLSLARVNSFNDCGRARNRVFPTWNVDIVTKVVGTWITPRIITSRARVRIRRGGDLTF